MNVEQFVMAYGIEQDRIRALLPDGFTSLRPVLRLNAELRDVRGYMEFNTAAEKDGRRGWLNIACWKDIPYTREGRTTTFRTDFLTLAFTAVGVEGGCPAEKDNACCRGESRTGSQRQTMRQMRFAAPETCSSIRQKRDGSAVSLFMRFTRSYMALMMSTISAPMRFCASTVAAPICGVQDTMGWLYSALLVAGSSAYTSRPAARTLPDSSAASRAASSTLVPREVLMTTTPSFILAMFSAEIRAPPSTAGA